MDFGTTTMTGWWFGSGVRNQLRCHDDLHRRLEGIHHHIAGAYLLRYAQQKSGLGEGQRPSVER